MVAMAMGSDSKRSWSWASDSTWLSSLHLSLRLHQSSAFDSCLFAFLAVFPSLSFLSVRPALFMFSQSQSHRCHKLWWFVRPCFPTHLSFHPSCQFCSTSHTPHVDVPIRPSALTTPRLCSFLLRPPSHSLASAFCCLSTVASCKPDVAQSPSCWHHDREAEEEWVGNDPPPPPWKTRHFDPVKHMRRTNILWDFKRKPMIKTVNPKRTIIVMP